MSKELGKPKFTHSESSPNLMNIHPIKNGLNKQVIEREISTGSEDSHDVGHQGMKTVSVSDTSSISSSESDVDLLEYLNKVDHSYRDIRFKIPNSKDHVPEAKKRYQKRVSFDTINLQYDDDSFDDYDDFDDDRSDDRGRRKSRLASPLVSPLHSPSGSPVRVRSPIRGSIDQLSSLELSKMFSNYKRPQYPTTPIITHRGCTLTKIHKDFEKLYSGVCYDKDNKHLSPVLPHRVILVYISGRKHTWVALDWVLNRYVEHGDTVIIVSAINSSSITKRRRNSNFTSTDRLIAKTPRMRLNQRNRPENVKNIAKNIMSYAMEVINPDVIARVSIELAVGKSKVVLQEMYKLYEPNLVVTGAKPSVKIGAPLRSWTSSKVTDRLVKNFPLPVIIVPSVNMSTFEKTLQNQINARYKGPVDETIDERPTINSSRSRVGSDDASISSNDSYSSFEEISDMFEEYKTSLRSKLDDLDSKGYDQNYFTDTLKSISDKSAEFCWDLKSIDPNFRGRGAKLARAITGSNRFGVVPYKTKSLLGAVEEPPKEKPKPYTPKAPSYKEMKRQLMMNQQQKQQQQQQQQSPPQRAVSPPKITVQSPDKELSLSPTATGAGSSVPPPKQTLKFVNLESPRNDRRESKSKDKLDRVKLQKSLSHDGRLADDSATRPQLEPLKSHPDLHVTHDSSGADDRKPSKAPKKKSRKFWKLFS